MVTNRGLLAAVLMSLLFTACSSTNVIRSDYAPRVSAKSADLEQRVKGASLTPVHLAAFEDNRKAKDAQYSDPKLVWVGRGTHSFRFGELTVADYLRRALEFDLRRLGFTVSTSDAPIDLAVKVNEARPVWDMGWSTVSPSYIYDYTVTARRTDRSDATPVTKNVRHELKGVAEFSGMSFEKMTDELLNDRLAEFHLLLAEELLTSLR